MEERNNVYNVKRVNKSQMLCLIISDIKLNFFFKFGASVKTDWKWSNLTLMWAQLPLFGTLIWPCVTFDFAHVSFDHDQIWNPSYNIIVQSILVK